MGGTAALGKAPKAPAASAEPAAARLANALPDRCPAFRPDLRRHPAGGECVYARPNGWNVKIFQAPTGYRSERFVHTETARDPSYVVDRAFDIAEAIKLGRRPWDDDH
jgi:hypothetical protein